MLIEIMKGKLHVERQGLQNSAAATYRHGGFTHRPCEALKRYCCDKTIQNISVCVFTLFYSSRGAPICPHRSVEESICVQARSVILCCFIEKLHHQLLACSQRWTSYMENVVN